MGTGQEGVPEAWSQMMVGKSSLAQQELQAKAGGIRPGQLAGRQLALVLRSDQRDLCIAVPSSRLLQGRQAFTSTTPSLASQDMGPCVRAVVRARLAIWSAPAPP